MAAASDENLVVVTGFGPFQGHESGNASWMAVQLLPNQIVVMDKVYNIKKMLIPVVYREVDAKVAEIWAMKPQMVLHCGVMGDGKQILMEKRAANHMFRRKDSLGHEQDRGTAVLRAKEADKKTSRNWLESYLPVHRMAIDLNKLPNRGSIYRGSNNCGDYMCAYMYIKSLDVNPYRCMFIHVPPAYKRTYPSNKTAEYIQEILAKCLEVLHHDPPPNDQ